MAGMEDAWIRVNRAKTNFQALKQQVADYRVAHPKAYTAGVESDLHGNARIVAHVRERPPKEWGLASGDILVDLRAALDYAIYALAIAGTGQDPPPFADKLEFPICDSDARWKEAVGRHKVAGLSDTALQWVEDKQPFKPGMGGTTAALRVLEDLVGVNKHRFIYVAWHRLHEVRLPMTLHNARIEEFQGYSHPGELEDGAILATFRVVRVDPAKEAEVKVEPALVTAVVIEPTSGGWLDLGDTLWRFTVMVEQYVAAMEAFI